MWKDEIVEGIRKHRDKHAKNLDYDLDRIYKDFKEKEKALPQKLVSLSPKKALSHSS
jgi:hypothetical protein